MRGKKHATKILSFTCVYIIPGEYFLLDTNFAEKFPGGYIWQKFLKAWINILRNFFWWVSKTLFLRQKRIFFLKKMVNHGEIFLENFKRKIFLQRYSPAKVLPPQK